MSTLALLQFITAVPYYYGVTILARDLEWWWQVVVFMVAICLRIPVTIALRKAYGDKS